MRFRLGRTSSEVSLYHYLHVQKDTKQRRKKESCQDGLDDDDAEEKGVHFGAFWSRATCPNACILSSSPLFERWTSLNVVSLSTLSRLPSTLCALISAHFAGAPLPFSRKSTIGIHIDILPFAHSSKLLHLFFSAGTARLVPRYGCDGFGRVRRVARAIAPYECVDVEAKQGWWAVVN